MEKKEITYEEFLVAFEIVSNAPHLLARYEARQKEIRDKQAELAYAEEKGEKRGELRGEKRGKMVGKQELLKEQYHDGDVTREQVYKRLLKLVSPEAAEKLLTAWDQEQSGVTPALS